MNREYIRTHQEASSCGVLSLPSPNGTSVLSFLHAGSSEWTSEDRGIGNGSERGHAHPVYHAVLYTGGRNTMIHDGNVREFSRGTLVLTDPDTVHEYRPRSSGGGSFIEITFNLRNGDAVLTDPWENLLEYWLGAKIPIPSMPVQIPPPHLEHLEKLMDEVVGALLSDDRFAEAAASLAMGHLVLELSRFFETETIMEGNTGVDRIEEARRMLEKRFAGKISIAELSEEACLSEGAFIRAFTARFGMPPMSYRKHLRVTAAQHLLSVSGLSVGTIAEKVGYGDIYAFSRAFREVSGMTASQWRKERRESTV